MSLREETQAAAEKCAIQTCNNSPSMKFDRASVASGYRQAAYNAPTILRAIEALGKIEAYGGSIGQIAYKAITEIQAARESGK